MNSGLVDPTPPPPAPARLHFHLLLGAVICPPMTLALGIILFCYNRAVIHLGREQRLWTHRLTALVLVDLAAAVAALFMIVTFIGKSPEEILGSSTPGGVKARSLIGITFAGKDGEEPVVKGLRPGWPAEAAGLKEGDRIVTIDGEPMETTKQVRERILPVAGGTPLRICVRRDGAEVALTVTTRPFRTGLFAPSPEFAPSLEVSGMRIWEGFVILLIIAGMAVHIRKRGRPGGRVWPGFFVALLGSGVFYVGALLVSAWLLEGWTLGGNLIAMVVWSASLAALSFGVIRFRPLREPAAPPGGPNLSRLHGFLLGFLYIVAGMLRINVVLNAVQVLLTGRPGVPDNPWEIFARLQLGGTGAALLVVSVALVGPLAEELLFRGILFPRLLARTGPRMAAWVSAVIFAVLHLHYGIFIVLIVYYGLVFAWVRYRTGGLLVPVLLHMGINGTVVAVLLAMSG